MVLDLDHPAEQTLKAYGLGRLDDTESSAVEQHITGCERCRWIVEDAPADSLVSLLRTSLSRSTDAEQAIQGAGGATPEPGSTASTLDSHPPLYQRVAQLLGGAAAETSAKPRAMPAEVPVPGGLTDHPRYQIVDHLGTGGMGTVFKAQHRLMNRAVAIKVINPALLNKPSVKERFLREVKAAAQLAHCNIVTAHDAEQSGDLHLLVMEYVQGETLAERIRHEGALPVTSACEFIRQAALGLQHAHERGMVHRDIKPANIMLAQVSSGTQSKLMDFGLACFHSESNSVEGITELGAIMGTPDYMAPEQALDPHTADIRADIYSLGCTLYHALAGQVPYPATTPLAKIDAHRAGRATSLKTIRPDVSAELSTVVERMMAKDPAKRFQTPTEIAEALLPFARSEPAMQSVPARRRRFPLIAATILIVLAPLAYFFGPTVFRFVTNQGVLVVETDDPDIEIHAKQGDNSVKVLDKKTGMEVLLAAGKYEIDIIKGKDGLKLSTCEFTLNRGGRQVVKVRWVVPKELAATDPALRKESANHPAAVAKEKKETLPLKLDLAARLGEARRAIDNNRNDDAITEASELLKLNPNSAEALYIRGAALVGKGKLFDSIVDLTAALRLDPTHRDALVNRSYAYLNTDQFDLSIVDCDRLLKLEPKSHYGLTALSNRGGAWAHKGRFDKGYADFDAASKLDPKDAIPPIWKGMILKRMGEEAKGQAEIDKGLKIAPHMKDYSFNRLDHVVPQPPPLDEWLQGREILTVSQDGKAMFKTIGAALDALKPGQVVKVLDKGPYREHLSRDLPENVGIISEVGTRIDLVQPSKFGPDVRNPKKFNYDVLRLRCPRNLRLSGFEIVGPKAEADASFTVIVNLAADGDLIVESCRVFFDEQERQAPPKPGAPSLPDGRIDFVSWSHQPGRLWIQDNFFTRHFLVQRPGSSIVVERNHLLEPRHEAFHMWAGVSAPPREIFLRHNFIQGHVGIKLDGTNTGPDHWAGTPVSITNNLIEAVSHGVWFSHHDDGKKGWYPHKVRIQNNIIRSEERRGVILSAKGMSEVRDTWRVSHNCYPYEPGGVGHFQTFSRGPSDKIEPSPFLSTDPKHADYLHIAAQSPLASAGAGGNLPGYIGPLAPGPAPKEGDWFTRLQQVGTPPRPLVWPIDDLKAGKIRQPSFAGIKPLVDDEVGDPAKSLLAKETKGETIRRFFENGRYVIQYDGTKGGAFGTFRAGVTNEPFALEAAARTKGKGVDGWGLYILGPEKRGLGIRLSARGTIRLEGPYYKVTDFPGPKIGLIAHKAIKQDDQDNMLLVILKDRYLELYVNGVAVCDPVLLDHDLLPATVLLTGLPNTQGARAEFLRVKMWPAKTIPSLESRGAVVK